MHNRIEFGRGSNQAELSLMNIYITKQQINRLKENHSASFKAYIHDFPFPPPPFLQLLNDNVCLYNNIQITGNKAMPNVDQMMKEVKSFIDDR